MDRIWLKHYPAGVAASVPADRYASLQQLFDQCFAQHAARPAFRCMGRSYSFGDIDAASRALAASLQALGLQRGERVALMLPNVPQYAVAVAAVLRAGLVLVNVDPLFTPRELEHQLKDSGAQAIILLENFATTLQRVADTLPLKHVILASLGDMLGSVKGTLVNQVQRNLKKQVPPFELPGALRFNDALARGRHAAWAPPPLGPDDIALLQYTGGTTGPSRAAVLLHRNLVANVLQAAAWQRPALQRVPPGEQLSMVCALPLHHIYGFTASLLLGLHLGACNLLIADAQDTGAMLKELARHRVHSFPAVDTLFGAIASHPDCGQVDWSHLVLALGGGMAVQPATARRWRHKTGCPIRQGYGLSEASPSVSCTPVDGSVCSGNIGLPLPGTELALLDEAGAEVAPGMAGEIAVRGPQVMAGYWQRPDETARVMTRDGFLRTGDIGAVDERGCFSLVERKKDLIMVGGLHVFPSEIESAVATLPGVLECAACGVPDGGEGEAVKLVVVRSDPQLAEADIRAFCDAHLAVYKRPRSIEFREALPRSAIGKLLRRQLRAAAA
ncbi:MAG TPA: AMP-binding protein [Rubrivivax sp.]|nr:AMP-binding protein [Rubrivivax sp.]HPO18685.1 AMP-binding protein [Rubrivivax sp.]